MYNIKYTFITIICIFFKYLALAQDFSSATQVIKQVALGIDSLALANVLQSADTVVNAVSIDSVALSKTLPTQKRDIETTIDYQAKDSIFFDLTNQMMYLYGESKIEYGDITLGAEKISLNWIDNTIQANYMLDSTGRKVGKPVFTEKMDSYETDGITYNFTTKKALINGIITEQEGAFMHGERAKKNAKDEMFIRGAKYTTCDHAYPHYYIKSSQLKVIPNNKVVSGPFNLYFGEIATPIGFPFGMFPQPKTKSSGILFPSYGEDAQRGFFLRNGGYYFDINEYIDLKLTGDLFTNGSYKLQSVSTYKRRYQFSGNFNLRYNKTVNPAFENNSFSKDFWLDWSHSPQSRGSSRFSASVSIGTSSYSANANNVSENYQQSVKSEFSSNVSYAKTFRGTPFNLSVSAQHRQNITTGVVSLSLPDMSLNMKRLYPLKNLKGIGDGIFGKLGLSYNMVMKNELSNDRVSNSLGVTVINRSASSDEIIGFNNDNLSILLKRARFGAKHTIPIATSFNLLKYFTISPNFNYTEVWYPKELKFSYNEQQKGVRVDTLRQFSRAGWYSSGASMSTRIYGIYTFRKGRVKAIRHVITPSVGYSHSPNFSDPAKGNYQNVQIDEKGTTKLLSKYEQFAYGGPVQGEVSSLSFSMNHNIEMKVKSKNDSIEETKKIKIFDNFAMSSSYNFLADSLKLSNINWNTRTNLFENKVSISVNGAFDPYVKVLDSISDTGVIYQRKIDKYTWNNGQGIGQLRNVNVAIGFNLKAKDKNGGSSEPSTSPTQELGGKTGLLNNGIDGVREDLLAGSVNRFVSTNSNLYVPFDIPWALNINYSLNFSQDGFKDPIIIQTLNFNGNVNITDKTRIGFNSGYDIKKRKVTVTQLKVERDLHCWTVNFNWVPFGPRQSYFVEIRVNSELLKDLKLDKRSRNAYSSF